MDDSISENQHNVVHLHLHATLDIILQSLQDRPKLGRPCQPNLINCLFVSLEDASKSIYLRVGCSIQIKTVADLVCSHVTGDSSKTKNCKSAIKAVRLYDLTYRKNCLFVLILLVLKLFMKRVGRA